MKVVNALSFQQQRLVDEKGIGPFNSVAKICLHCSIYCDLIWSLITQVSIKWPRQTVQSTQRQVNLRRVGDGCQQRAASQLEEAAATQWGKLFLRELPAFQSAFDLLQTEVIEDTHRVSVKGTIEELYTFSSLINRTRRRDIGEFTTRTPETLHVPFNLAQQELHDKILLVIAKILSASHGQQNVKFMMTTVRRQAASCLYGLKPLLSDILAGKVSKSRMPKNKSLLFTTFRHTLSYLSERCENEAFRFGVIHGGISDEERADLRSRFAIDKGHADAIDVLLSSEVGCEGLDFQFCGLMVKRKGKGELFGFRHAVTNCSIQTVKTPNHTRAPAAMTVKSWWWTNGTLSNGTIPMELRQIRAASLSNDERLPRPLSPLYQRRKTAPKRQHRKPSRLATSKADIHPYVNYKLAGVLIRQFASATFGTSNKQNRC